MLKKKFNYSKKALLLIMMCVSTLSIMVSSCGDKTQLTQEQKDSLRYEYYDTVVWNTLEDDPTHKKTLAYVDSLAATGSVPEPILYFFYGNSYNYLGQTSSAILYYEKGYEGDALFNLNRSFFYSLCDDLSILYLNSKQDDRAAEVAQRCYDLTMLDNTEEDLRFRAAMLHTLGYVLVDKGKYDDAEQKFSMATWANDQLLAQFPNYFNRYSKARILYNILDAYTGAKQYDRAMQYIKPTEEAVDSVMNDPDPRLDENIKMNCLGDFLVHKAFILRQFHFYEAADSAFAEAKESGFFRTQEGMVTLCSYLSETQQWEELASYMPDLDTLSNHWPLPYSMDYLNSFILPQIKAYTMTGQKDKAVEAAMKLASISDSVVAYETEQRNKDLQVIESQKDRIIASAHNETYEAHGQTRVIIVVFILLVFGIITYGIIRFLGYMDRRKKNQTSK